MKKCSTVTTECAFCKRSDPSNACGRCMVTIYCDKNCQMAHWKESHKGECVPVEARKPDFRVPQQPAEDNDCPICLGCIQENESCKLPCSHRFHIDCVEGLRKLASAQLCPMCRSSLPQSPEKNFLFLKSQLDAYMMGSTVQNKALFDGFQMLADQGHNPAFHCMGLMLFKGLIVEVDYTKAEVCFLKSKQPVSLLYLTLIFEDKGDIPRAKQFAVDALKRGGDKQFMSSAHSAYAKLCVISKDLDLAVHHFEQGLYFYPKSSMALYGLGLVYVELELYTKSVPMFRELVSMEPSNNRYLLCGGNSLLKVKDYKGAKSMFIKSLAVVDDNVDALLGMLKIYCLEKNALRAHDMFSRGKKVYPSNYKFTNCYCNFLIDQGEHSKAKSLLDECIAAADNLKSRVLLGGLLYKEQKYKEALVEFEHAETLGTKTILDEMQRKKGDCKFRLGDFEGAIHCLRRAIKHNAGDGFAWLIMGVCMKKINQLKSSEAAFRQALRINAENHYAWRELGMLCMQNGKLEDAEFAVARSIEIKGDKFDNYPLLAKIKVTMGKNEEAVDIIKNMAVLVKNDISISGCGNCDVVLAKLYFTLGKHDEVERIFKGVLESSPQDEDALYYFKKNKIRICTCCGF